MSPKTINVAVFAAIALLGSVHAATISWGPVMAISAASDVSTTGTLATAVYMGNSGDQVVNGVTFSAAGATAGTSIYTGFTLGNIDAVAGTQPSSGPAGVTGSYATILDQMVENFIGAPTLTLTLTGLSASQEYQIQFWAADYRTQYGDLGRSETLTAGNTSGALTFLRSGGSASGSYILGTFTADGATQAITINGSGDAIVNAFQLRAIPEPSTALLSGLGMLALLRRRR